MLYSCIIAYICVCVLSFVTLLLLFKMSSASGEQSGNDGSHIRGNEPSENDGNDTTEEGRSTLSISQAEFQTMESPPAAAKDVALDRQTNDAAFR